MRLKTREGARTDDRQVQRRRSVRVGQCEDGCAVVLPEHPVVRLKAAPNRLRQLPHHGRPVVGLVDEPFDRLAGEAEQKQVLCHHDHPQVHGVALIWSVSRLPSPASTPGEWPHLGLTRTRNSSNQHKPTNSIAAGQETYGPVATTRRDFYGSVRLEVRVTPSTSSS